MDEDPFLYRRSVAGGAMPNVRLAAPTVIYTKAAD
jgi:hypothetical protein